jgi:hypothetical protein
MKESAKRKNEKKWKLRSSVKYTHRRARINANTLPYLAREKNNFGTGRVEGGDMVTNKSVDPWLSCF